MKKVALVIIISILAGCATGYKTNGFGGGFEDTELSPNYFRISFRGNGVTSSERVYEYALLRASDLMMGRECKSFQVLNLKNQTDTSYIDMPKTSTTSANVYTYGNYATGNATTTSFGGGLQSVNKAKTTLDVKCSNQEADPSLNIYDTNFINQKLKLKYKIE